MALERIIRRKVDALRTKTRLELIGNMTAHLSAVGISVWGMAHFPDSIQRIIFCLIVLWAVLGSYFLHRGLSTKALPAEAEIKTGLDFYRHEIERRRLLNGRVLSWSLGPLLAAIFVPVLQLLTLGHFKDMLPFLSLFVLWIGSFVVLAVRKQMELLREVDDLNDTELISRGKT